MVYNQHLYLSKLHITMKNETFHVDKLTQIPSKPVVIKFKN